MNKPAVFVLGALLLVAIGGAIVVAIGPDPTPKAVVESPRASEAAGDSSKGLLESLGLGDGRIADNSFGEFLDPDIAFRPSIAATDAGALEVQWEIADDYYLYKDKFQFRVLEPEGVTLGQPGLPPAKIKDDEFFGRMEVYYQRVRASLPVINGDAQSGDIKLEVGYQGCADAGLCYPPLTKTLDVARPAQASGGTITNPQGNPTTILNAQYSLPSSLRVSEQDRIASVLASGTLWLTLVTFFGFGLLLAFTPCVLPMLPILSSTIVGQGKTITTRRAFLLSLTFALAMATANDTEDQTLSTELGLFGPPAILFFGPDGNERRPYRVIGFMDAGSFSRHLRAVLSG